MLMPVTRAADQDPRPAQELLEELWLLGLPPLTRLLEFVDDAVADAEAFDRRALVDAWRVANDHYQALERSEAGIANEGDHRELDAVLQPLADAVAAEPRFCRTFDTLPTRFAMVDLEHLIVDQQHVSAEAVDAIAARLGPRPDAAALFRLCLACDAPPPPVHVRKVGEHRYVFRSPSTDLRFHEPTLLSAERASGYDSFGAIAGIVGLVVGFSANVLNVVQVGRRMLLNNGYHRAVALRTLGVRHAPCVVQTATRVDELRAAFSSRIADRAEFYFESARPPLLRDFFDPRLHRRLRVQRQLRQIEVQFEIRDHLVRA